MESINLIYGKDPYSSFQSGIKSFTHLCLTKITPKMTPKGSLTEQKRMETSDTANSTIFVEDDTMNSTSGDMGDEGWNHKSFHLIQTALGQHPVSKTS